MKKYTLGLNFRVLISLFAAVVTSQAGIFTNLHTFVNGSVSDGSGPYGTVLINGQLFGAAQQGGSLSRGMIYTLGTNGTGFVSIHDFGGNAATPPDGDQPNELLLAGNTFYGTTYQGGTNSVGNGIIFKMNTDGSSYTILRSFTNSPDPEFSLAGLIIGGTTLYGTSLYGGVFNQGTVFKIDTSGANFAVLHSFTNNPDGANPHCRLVLNGSTLYGTTAAGGTNAQGIIFKLNTDGSGYSAICQFSNQPASTAPYAGLTYDNNTLYGASTLGGTGGAGTIFRLSTTGAGFTIIHAFTNTEGLQPQSVLLVTNSLIYGSTLSGGGSGVNGTVFQLGTNGANFTVLKYFTNGLTGANPSGGLVLTGNTIYGVANAGGPNGGGTAYRLVLAPVINTQPQNQSAPSGGSASFNVSADDEFPITYQWYLNTTTLLGGQTASTLNIGSVNNGNTGNYTVVVSDNVGSVTSSPASLTISSTPTLPSITGQPQGLTRNVGTSASFTVAATSNSGSPTYQWYFNTNTLLGGQTGATLTLPSVATTDAGAYTVVVGNTVGSVTSSPALLAVLNPPPAITGQPQSLTRNVGTSASFTVTATSSSGGPTYQWYFNTNTLLGGQTAATLTLPSVAPTDAGAYTVVASNPGGSVTSSPALLTVVNPPPSITAQPQSLTVTNGNQTTFSVTASGNGTLLYQWYFNTNTLVAGQTNSTYSIPVTFTNYAGYYTVVVANGGGAVTSSPAKLTVSLNSKPIISDQSPDQIVSSGDTVNIFVTASGLNPLGYQWYTNSTRAIGKATSLRTTASFSFVCTTNNNNLYLTVVVTNTLGKATSNPALLTVVGIPLIVTNPQPVSVGVGNPASFSVVALGPTNKYQWYSNSVNTAIGTALATQTNSTYSLTASTASNGKYYSVVVTNTFGRATSSLALLTVVSLPTITLQPLGATITNGGPVTFTSAGSGVGTLGYQWLYQTNTLIPGATSTTLTFATANQPGTYSMMVTNSFGAATSSPALLTVIGRPTLLGSSFDPASGSYSFSYVNLAGSTNRLQATTNLVDPNAWQAIATNYMATNGIWQFIDSKTAQTNAVRLYRFSSP